MLGVTYVLTSCNKAAHLPCALESIARERAQTGGEIIIVDDGSIDGSIDLCQNFAATHPDVTFMRLNGQGVFAAYNRAIPLAKGKWLRLCDCDDPLIIGSTGYLVELAAMDCADMAYGQAVPYGPAPLPISELNAVRPVSYASLVHADALLHLIQSLDLTASRALYRTAKARQSVPLPENLISCPDFALALRVAAKGRLVRLREPVCYCLSGPPAQQKMLQTLMRHQTIRVLQASRRFLRWRHRNAAVTELYKWSRRGLRKDARGWRFQIRKIRLKALVAVTRMGLYDWHSALDAFASQYEPELAQVFKRRLR